MGVVALLTAVTEITAFQIRTVKISLNESGDS